ncbi:MAG TPA: hypothetical protein VG963_04060 [Polyangiaceae bacterium]|nr:hypothetical protein [Polyangiaceae bacterium]HVZ31573.1 hypothetical protein [Polyangiaceae bacterium]
MTNREPLGTGPRTAHVLERIREVEAGVDSMIGWASEAGADVATIDLLLCPHREMLTALRERDLPVAAMADALDR